MYDSAYYAIVDCISTAGSPLAEAYWFISFMVTWEGQYWYAWGCVYGCCASACHFSAYY